MKNHLYHKLTGLFLFLLINIMSLHAQISGCTDIKANNYNAAATINDGSCTFGGANVSPVSSKNLAAGLVETSGLIHWNQLIWTHNDNRDNRLYALDTSTAVVQNTYTIPSSNLDWEDIAQDENYVYIGDFGNNGNGNRTNLHILRAEKTSLLSGTPLLDTLYFSYSNQSNFNPAGANNTDFDCEALIVSQDSIYLFTKQWVSEKSAVYVLPKTPGTHIAQLRTTLSVQGLITGATYLADKRLVVLCGYSKLLQPFLYLLYDFNNHDFSKGNKRRIDINLPFHQVEGIATENGLKYYISNEKLDALNVPQKLHTLNLSNLLNHYVNAIPTHISASKLVDPVQIFPNPTDGIVQINSEATAINKRYCIYDAGGRLMMEGILTAKETLLNIQHWPAGNYFMQTEGLENGWQLIKK